MNGISTKISHYASPFQEIMLSLKRFFSAETVTWQKKNPNAKDLVKTILWKQNFTELLP